MVTGPGGIAALSELQARQPEVYRVYWMLQSIAEPPSSGALAGSLVLGVGFGQHGTELALATTLAGGVFLGIEPDTERLKVAVRNGSCDFMVNTLDESLRVLKNELRKRTPLSAGLLGVPDDILPAMVDRGVQPELVANTYAPEYPLGLKGVYASPTARPQDAATPADAALRRMVRRGAKRVSAELTKSSENPSAIQVEWIAANPQDLRQLDRTAMDLLPKDDPIRFRWLQQAAGCFYRRRPLARVIGFDRTELENFLAASRRAAASSAFQAAITIRWQAPGEVTESLTL